MKYLISANLIVFASFVFEQNVEKSDAIDFHYELGSTLHLSSLFNNSAYPINFDFRFTKNGKYFWGKGFSIEFQNRGFDYNAILETNKSREYGSYLSFERRIELTEKFQVFAGIKYLFGFEQESHVGVLYDLDDYTYFEEELEIIKNGLKTSTNYGLLNHDKSWDNSI